MEDGLLQEEKEEVSTVEVTEENILESEKDMEVVEETVVPDTESPPDDVITDTGQDDEVLEDPPKEEPSGEGTLEEEVPEEEISAEEVPEEEIPEKEIPEEEFGESEVSENGSVSVNGIVDVPPASGEAAVSPDLESPDNAYVYMVQDETPLSFFESDINDFSRSEIMLFLMLCLLLAMFLHNIFKGSHWFRRL